MTEKEYKDLYTKGQCSDCKYKVNAYPIGSAWMCNYCHKTGHRRNSLPPTCNKYEKKRKNRHIKRGVKNDSREKNSNQKFKGMHS